MKKLFSLLLAVCVGVVLGRIFDGEPSTAEAGGGAAAVAGNGNVNGDGSIDVSDASYLLNWLFLGGPDPEPCPGDGGGASGLPDTGQTICYDASGQVVDCASDTCAGQDGFYATGCPSEGRFVDNEDGTVTDTCTGLTWQKDTADINRDGEITDGPDRVIWCDALAYCETLELAGHDDWRLPNIRELQSIVDYGRVLPAIDPVFGALSSFYWSSTSNGGSPDLAWGVGFVIGIVGNGFKGGVNGFVRAVRSGP